MVEFTFPIEGENHRDALEWFAARSGQEVGWPVPVGDMFLMNRAKGIHKPRGMRYALSIRQSLSGPYADALHIGKDGAWFLEYNMEGANPSYFTNVALRACMEDGVPVGVVIQTIAKPNPRYKVLGLGNVTKERTGSFTIRQFGAKADIIEAGLNVIVTNADFDAKNNEDARKITTRSIAVRRGQPAFRQALLAAYQGKCAITGCTVGVLLEAAHILPYQGDHTNHVQNGLLLRTDIHTLLDLGLLAIRPSTYEVVLSKRLSDSEYWHLHGQKMTIPLALNLRPSDEALAKRTHDFLSEK